MSSPSSERINDGEECQGGPPIFNSAGGVEPPSQKGRNSSRAASTRADKRASRNPAIAKKLQSMKSNERPSFELDPAYSKEWVKRSTDWYMNMNEGGKIRKDQEELRELGSELQEKRLCLKRSLEETARKIGITPMLLCFLESGWGTADEFRDAMEEWTVALGVESGNYINRLPVSKGKTR